MNSIFIFFIAAVLLLVGLLLFALRAPKSRLSSPDAVFETLSAPRHFFRLPQILMALQVSDTEFLNERGRPDLCRQIRLERKRIALEYVKNIETDYGNLIEASRVLAAMAPEVVATQEWDRLRLGMAFHWKCRLLRWKLRTGLKPWSAFAQISEMASDLSYRMEQATTQIGERAALASQFPSLLKEGDGDPR